MTTSATLNAALDLAPAQGARPREFTIASNFAGHSNAYVLLFYEALRQYDTVLCPDVVEIGSDWLERNGPHVDALHFHWPENCWRHRQSFWVKWLGARQIGWSIARRVVWRLKMADRLISPAFAVRQMKCFLKAAKARGLRIVWTLHNIEPHERPAYYDSWGYKLLARSADLVICHSESEKARFLERYPTDANVVIMPHGNFDSAYPAPRERSAVVRELGLREDLPIAACLGAMRPYKGLDIACDAIERLGGRVQLVIGGMPLECDFDLQALKARVERLPQARLIARSLSEQEFADLAAAGDVHVFPYRQITGSGAFLAALTFSRPAVVSALEFFEEMLRQEPDAGILCPVGDASAFANAIDETLTQRPEARRVAARRLADRIPWKHVVEPVGAAINRWRAG